MYELMAMLVRLEAAAVSEAVAIVEDASTHDTARNLTEARETIIDHVTSLVEAARKEGGENG